MRGTRQDAKRRRAARAREREGEKRHYSDEEKRAIRAEHQQRIAEALAALESPEGMARFLAARELNPQLSPLTCAIVAQAAPGTVVAPLRWWSRQGHRVRKGSHAVAFGTRPGFWPDPLFAAEQTDYPDEYVEAARDEIGTPTDGLVAAAVESLAGTFRELGRKAPALNAWCEAEAI